MSLISFLSGDSFLSNLLRSVAHEKTGGLLGNGTMRKPDGITDEEWAQILKTGSFASIGAAYQAFQQSVNDRHNMSFSDAVKNGAVGAWLGRHALLIVGLIAAATVAIVVIVKSSKKR